MKQPARSGKNAVKAEWRAAFWASKSWENAFFQRFVTVEASTGSKSEGEWRSWKELTDTLGEALATTLYNQGVIEERPWPGVDPNLQVNQYKRQVDKDFRSHTTKQTQQVSSEALQITDQACQDFQSCAESFGEGGSGAVQPVKGKGPNKDKDKDKDDPNNAKLVACLASVKKGLQALDAKAQAARSLQHQVDALKPDKAKYAQTMKEDMAKIMKKTDRPRKNMIDVKTNLQGANKDDDNEALFQKANDSLALSGKILKDRQTCTPTCNPLHAMHMHATTCNPLHATQKKHVTLHATHYMLCTCYAAGALGGHGPPQAVREEGGRPILARQHSRIIALFSI